MTAAHSARHDIDRAYAEVNNSSASEEDKATLRAQLESADAKLRKATAPEVYGQ